MNSTVKIYFKGLAACHHNGSNWEVFFICDKTHELNFYDTGSLRRTSLKKAKSINIKAEGSVVPRKLSAAQDEECRKSFRYDGGLFAQQRRAKKTERRRICR